MYEAPNGRSAIITSDLTRTLLAIIFIALLGGVSFWVLSPFLPALIWAVMLVIATWPIMLRLQSHLGNRRLPAVIVMVVLLLLILILPFMVVINALLEHAEDIAGLPALLSHITLPPPPDWLSTIPFAGPRLAEKWQIFASAGVGAIPEYLQSYSGQFSRWILTEMGNFALLIINFLLVVVISAILYSTGETATAGVRRFAFRLAGARGEDSALLAAQAIRAVALGIIVTAMVQAIFGGIGLAVAGVPYTELLMAAIFVLGVAQIGSGPVLLLAAAWLFWQGDTSWGVAMLVWTVIVGSMDNFLRPLLIKRGANLPLLLIFAGVIGGLITFGIIGLFIGPLVLAVTYTLLKAWVNDSLVPAPDGREPRTVSEAETPLN